jgi:hypothetical protein
MAIIKRQSFVALPLLIYYQLFLILYPLIYNIIYYGSIIYLSIPYLYPILIIITISGNLRFFMEPKNPFKLHNILPSGVRTTRGNHSTIT